MNHVPIKCATEIISIHMSITENMGIIVNTVGLSSMSSRDILFFELVCNGLLSLYMEVAYQHRRMPPQARAAWLLKYLKPKLKSATYKSIRSDLRRLVNYGRSAPNQLEIKMLELIDSAEVVVEPHQANTHVYQLARIFNDVNVRCKLRTEVYNEQLGFEKGTVYVFRENVDGAFLEGLISREKFVILSVPETDLEHVQSLVGEHAWYSHVGEQTLSEGIVVLHITPHDLKGGRRQATSFLNWA